MTHRVTVLVVDDEQPIRNLVALTLQESGYSVLTAAAGDEALVVFKEHQAHIRCLMTDCEMPGMSGPQLARHLLTIQPDLRLIFMSGRRSSVAGHWFLAKPFTPGQVRACARDAIQGGSSVRLAERVSVIRERGQEPELSAAQLGERQADSLTPREAEILVLLARSFSTRGVAKHLRIAYKTVECHRSRIYSKLGVHKVAELVRYAIRNGLIEA
jgi:DNA-binding NarL/FixJ family response regulator